MEYIKIFEDFNYLWLEDPNEAFERFLTENEPQTHENEE
jgi:hypothetical protein